MPPIEVQDTDLLLINRDDVTYKVTAADLDLTGAAPVNPNPDDVTVSPAVEGDGSEFNPYRLTSNSVEFGETIFSNETITIVNQKIGNLVTWTDLNSDRNETRYNQAIGTIATDGTFSTKLRFLDSPQTDQVKTYSATIRLTDSNIYFVWAVDVVAPVTPPVLNSITLVDTRTDESSRFQGGSFATTFNLDEGNPISTKSVAYKVEGRLTSQAITSEIVGVNTTSGNTTLTLTDDTDFDLLRPNDIITQSSPAGPVTSSITGNENQASGFASANKVSDGVNPDTAIGIFTVNEVYFISNNNQMFYSSDGINWTMASGGASVGNDTPGIDANEVMVAGAQSNNTFYKSTNYGASYAVVSAAKSTMHSITSSAHGKAANGTNIWLAAGGTTNNSTSVLYCSNNGGGNFKQITSGQISGNNGASLKDPVYFLGSWYIIYRTGYNGPNTQTQTLWYSQNVDYEAGTSNWGSVTATNTPANRCSSLFVCNNLLFCVYSQSTYGDIAWTSDGLSWQSTPLQGIPLRVYYKEGTYYTIYKNSGNGQVYTYYSEDLYTWTPLELKQRSTYQSDESFAMNEAGRFVYKGFYNDPNNKAPLYLDYAGDQFTTITFDAITNFDQLNVGDTVTQKELTASDLSGFTYALVEPVTTAGAIDRREEYYTNTQTALLGDMTDPNTILGTIVDAGSSSTSIEMKISTSSSAVQGSNDLKNWTTVGAVSPTGNIFTGYRYYATQELNTNVGGVTVVSGVDPQLPTGTIKYIDTTNKSIQVRPVDPRWAIGQTINGAQTTGRGTFVTANIASLTINLSNSTGYWSANTNRTAKGPVKTLDNTVKYLETNNLRQVTGVSRVPSYHENTALTDEITFDLPTGTGLTWDEELPDGTTIQSQAFADNTTAGGSRSPETGTIDSERLQPVAVLTVSDLFATTLWTGNGVSNRNITSGIDNTVKSLVWVKSRTTTQYHNLADTVRGTGIGGLLYSNLTAEAGSSEDRVNEFTSTGYKVGVDQSVNSSNGSTYVGWNFRAAPKFFDIQQYVGNKIAGTKISHALTSVPGAIIVKGYDNDAAWRVYHKDLGPTKALFLNSDQAEYVSNSSWNDTAPTSIDFTVGIDDDTNKDGGNFVAYLFADEPGLIKCGAELTGGYNNGVAPFQDCGFRPQWILMKGTDTSNWFIWNDRMPAFDTGENRYEIMFADTSDAQQDFGPVVITDTGFSQAFQGGNYIWIAIAAPVVRNLTQAEVNATKLLFDTTEFRIVKHEQDIVARAAELRAGFEARGFTTAEIDKVLGSE